MDYKKYQVNIPEGKSGNWKVEKFTVSEDEAKFANMRASFSFSNRGQYIYAGEYTRLMRGTSTIMSDTPSEISDHRYFMRVATGNVLLNGLGLGMVLQAILRKDDVEKVVVNEIDQDVINIVAPHYQDQRLVINHTDAFAWKPNGIRFNSVWHDIWDNICEDNLSEMKQLHRRYGHWLQQPSFQGSWGR